MPPASAPESRYRLTVAYDGARYHGMPVLPDVPTVQGELERVLTGLLGHPVRLEAASRTDAGVHARGQVAHFDSARVPYPARLLHALNRLLPDDIRVTALRRAPPDFHARFSATGKEYRYRLHQAAVLPPLLRFDRLHAPQPLDLPAMRRAARALEGEHDFASFAWNPGYKPASTVRRITRLAVVRRGPEVEIRVTGESFLPRMVRALAGYLLNVGTGRADPDQTTALLAARRRHPLIVTAPAHGLCLWRVGYGRNGRQASGPRT
jgi:tRNA pseudouridine38-40 synthase